MKKIIYTLLIWFSFSPSVSFATYDNALLMFSECTAEAKTEIEQLKNIHCLGYVSGLIDGYSTISPYTKQFFCPPKEGIEVGHALMVLGRHLLASKQKDISTGRTELLIALTHKFPCT